MQQSKHKLLAFCHDTLLVNFLQQRAGAIQSRSRLIGKILTAGRRLPKLLRNSLRLHV